MEILYPELSYNIINAALQVFNEQGTGFLEKVYQEELGICLEERGIKYEREKKIDLFFHGRKLSTPYYCDLLVDDKIIVELKVTKTLEDIHQAQLLNYLKATGFQLGILINFGESSLKYKRLINLPRRQ